MTLNLSGDGSVSGVTSINTNISSTELGYVDGVTSAIQTQLNNKANLADGYQLREIVTFTSSGTFSKGSYSWLRAIRVICQGGGGGGGGANGPAVGVGGGAGAGGGGAYAESFITNIAGLASSVTVTVGTGGGGGVGNTVGTSGGTTSFGALVSANGGAGGAAGNNTMTSFPQVINISGGRGQGATTATGDITVPGQSANITWVPSIGESWCFGGGASVLGATRSQASTDGGGFGMDGYAGGGKGAGGNGALVAQNTGSRNGGAGSAGIVIVELYA